MYWVWSVTALERLSILKSALALDRYCIILIFSKKILYYIVSLPREMLNLEMYDKSIWF